MSLPPPSQHINTILTRFGKGEEGGENAAQHYYQGGQRWNRRSARLFTILLKGRQEEPSTKMLQGPLLTHSSDEQYA
jgi:hypothetical protein